MTLPLEEWFFILLLTNWHYTHDKFIQKIISFIVGPNFRSLGIFWLAAVVCTYNNRVEYKKYFLRYQKLKKHFLVEFVKAPKWANFEFRVLKKFDTTCRVPNSFS